MLIVVGDALQTGGSVLTGSPHTDIEGRAVARVGDRVICARHGPGSIVSGDSTLIIDGQPVARDGDKASCGCALMAGKQQRAHVAGGGGGSGSGAVMTAVAAAAKALLKTPQLQTPGFAPPGTQAPQCWVDDHSLRVSCDADGRYFESYAPEGDRYEYDLPVNYQLEVPLSAGGDIVVRLKIRLVAQERISAAEVAATKRRMTEGLDGFWNGQFRLQITDAPCGSRTFPLRFVAEFVPSGEDVVMELYRHTTRAEVFAGRIAIGLNSSAWVHAHEFAHCLGLPDEYIDEGTESGTIKYFRPDGILDSAVVTTQASRTEDDPEATIMFALDSTLTKPRHAWGIAREVRELLTEAIGREIVCAVS
ncbi:PAAR domain-containing protein [Stenotrophomonas maltophilia]|uniref:PAAR domain-containing protein n=1 Tax=Stenotrophomonas maltophilia TaxID=40324 RepID=UPI002155463A|nr:PAAR domain-containing protein [Stenotrophomonas maltophilia]